MAKAWGHNSVGIVFVYCARGPGMDPEHGIKGHNGADCSAALGRLPADWELRVILSYIENLRPASDLRDPCLKNISLTDRELNRQLRAYTARAEDPSAVASTRFPYHSWTSACNSSFRRSHTSGLMSAFGKRRQKDPEPEVSLSLFQTITTRIPAKTSVDSFSSRWEPVKKRERPLGASQSKRKKKRERKNLRNIKHVWGVL